MTPITAFSLGVISALIAVGIGYAIGRWGGMLRDKWLVWRSLRRIRKWHRDNPQSVEALPIHINCRCTIVPMDGDRHD